MMSSSRAPGWEGQRSVGLVGACTLIADFSNLPAASMVLLEIDAGGVCAVEFECDAPRAVHMDGVARRVEAFQRVEVKTRQVHVFRLLGHVQTVKPNQNALLHLGVNL
ncbi:protein of unknown function [Aminobacter niigataensis]|nr:protein of unknown function [Aminobacter niigataensis]